MSGGPGKQRYIAVDERHVGAEDLPGANLMRAVLGLEQSRTPKDVMGVAGLLAEWLWGPRDDGLWTRRRAVLRTGAAMVGTPVRIPRGIDGASLPAGLRRRRIRRPDGAGTMTNDSRSFGE